MSDGEGGGAPPAGTSVNYALAIFYLLIGVLVIIVGWVMPGINLASSIAFTLIGTLVVIAAVVQIVYIAQATALLCGSCPPPTPGA
jgi:hypothetical protein